MSYPFGSGGMPQPNNQHPPNPQYPAQPFGVGYPQGGAMPGGMPGYPQPGGAAYGGYPPQQQYPPQPYPPHQPHQHQPYPPQPFGGYPAAGAAYPSMPQFGVPPQTPAASGYVPYGQQPQPPPSGGGYNYYQQQPQQQPQLQPQQQPGGAHYAGQRPGGFAGAPVAHLPKGQPTLLPAANFNATEDAQKLRKAMKGFGTDEDGLIAVLCHRSNDQIQQIKSAYKTNFGRDLLEDIRSETSGRFEDVLAALLLPRLDYYVKELNDAMAGLGTDEDALIEVLCSLSNYEIQAIKHHYKQVYYKDLESELIGETSGHFKRLLVSLCVGGRDESGLVDPVAAQRDATDLLQAGELMVGTDESVFNAVLCQRGYSQIRLVCDEYQKVTGHSLVKAIEREFSGDIRDGLVAVVQCMTNKAEFFAARLHKSMAGIGTTDSQLIRVIVMRAEVDLYDVKVAFERLYGKPLRSWIKGDTSGHYKHALYHLIGETETK